MNEVSIKSVGSHAAPIASLKGGVEVVAEASGKKLPQVTDIAEKEEVKASEKPQQEVSVEQAVASISEYVQSVQRDLQFSVDEELNQTIVKVVDGRSGELIRQIPEEAFLELARKLNDGDGLRLFDALG